MSPGREQEWIRRTIPDFLSQASTRVLETHSTHRASPGSDWSSHYDVLCAMRRAENAPILCRVKNEGDAAGLTVNDSGLARASQIPVSLTEYSHKKDFMLDGKAWCVG